MKLLALDVSGKSTGWFVSKASCGQIKTSPKASLDERLVEFRKSLQVILAKYKPTVVVIEDTYFSKSPKTLKYLAMFHGVARELCSSLGIEVKIMTATQARKYCCGKQEGEFKKEQVFKYFVEKYGFTDFKFEDHNDLTDAAALFWGFREKEKQDKKNSKDTQER